MGSLSDGVGTNALDSVIQALADVRRRRVLSFLDRHDGPATERVIATHLAAAETSATNGDVVERRVRDVRIRLRHASLPILENAGLVDWTPARERVGAVTNPALEDAGLGSLLEIEREEFDAVLECLANERRRLVLSTLADRSGPVHRIDLVHAVAAELRSASNRADSVADVDVSLRHVHLPKLQETELIDVDAASGTVSYLGHAAIDGGLLARLGTPGLDSD